jgi:hypothetical protein
MKKLIIIAAIVGASIVFFSTDSVGMYFII